MEEQHLGSRKKLLHARTMFDGGDGVFRVIEIVFHHTFAFRPQSSASVSSDFSGQFKAGKPFYSPNPLNSSTA